MKINSLSCIQDLQPDGYEPDEPVRMCICGHECDWHDQVGPLWECIGSCEAVGCLCGEFEEEEDDV
jgi:hypothetical protein